MTLAMDRAMKGRDTLTLAVDRSSVRELDEFGRLVVHVANISKANVCPYRGEEIPDWEKLGLDRDRIYKLYRHPEELAKAATTFNGIQLLYIHEPLSADDPKKELVVGTTGTDAAFVAPYLQNSLRVWDAEAIAAIESGQQKELSCSYGYDADMTSGSMSDANGQFFFDGIMRNIVGNHVALVEAGRAGSDVVVGDSKLETVSMSKPLMSRKALMVRGAVAAYIKPKLASDAKLDLNGVLSGVTRANFAAQKPVVTKRLATATKGKLAADADLSDFHELLDSLDDEDEGDIKDSVAEAVVEALTDGEEDDEPAAEDADPDETDEEKAKRLAAAKDKKAKDAMRAKDRAAKDAEEDDDKKKAKDKKAMDAALDAMAIKVRADMRAVREAERAVEPFVGQLAIAMDSADDIYKFALEQQGVDVADVHPSAFPAMLALIAKPGAQEPRRLASDSAAVSGFEKRFPSAAAVQHVY